MARKAWFDEERIELQEAHVFIPHDIESPLHRPIIDPDDSRLLPARHEHPDRGCPHLIVTSLARVVRRSQARRGRERETSNLSKFVFAALRRLLEVQFLTRRLGSAEVEAVREFVGARGRLSSYEQLLQSESIRVVVQAMLESSQVVREILESRMAYCNKVMALRVLENIRSVCCSPVRRWKP
jgi:hypothetical protein